MGKLERARIHVLKGDGTKESKDDTFIEVCFNPKEYSLEKSVEWDAEKAFSDAPQPEFKAPKPMTLSVTLQFDTYEERTNVRDKWVRKIEKLTMMTGDLPKDGTKAVQIGQAEVSAADHPVHLGPLHLQGRRRVAVAEVHDVPLRRHAGARRMCAQDSQRSREEYR